MSDDLKGWNQFWEALNTALNKSSAAERQGRDHGSSGIYWGPNVGTDRQNEVVRDSYDRGWHEPQRKAKANQNVSAYDGSNSFYDNRDYLYDSSVSSTASTHVSTGLSPKVMVVVVLLIASSLGIFAIYSYITNGLRPCGALDSFELSACVGETKTDLLVGSPYMRNIAFTITPTAGDRSTTMAPISGYVGVNKMGYTVWRIDGDWVYTGSPASQGWWEWDIGLPNNPTVYFAYRYNGTTLTINSPDKTYLAEIESNNTIVIRRISDNNIVKRLELEPEQFINGFALSEDGNTLVSLSSDQQLYLRMWSIR